MRVGSNPEKSNPKLEIKNHHRVIMPVYIPNLEGYFKDALKILETSLHSLFLTLPKYTVVTIIDNNSCAEVKHVLETYRTSGKIDKLIINASNQGKIDAIIGAARACYEPLITFTDADVFFKNGWFEEAIKIFTAYPECGMVSYTPDPVKLLGFTDSTLLYALFNRKRCQINSDSQERDFFANSIGIAPHIYYAGHHKGKLSALNRDGVIGVIGAHHFVCTLNRNFLENVPKRASMQKITGNSEIHYIDKPVDKRGFLKLSTPNDMVYHLGNVWEPWMANSIQQGSAFDYTLPKLRSKGPLAFLPYRVRNKLVSLFFRTDFRKLLTKF